MGGDARPHAMLHSEPMREDIQKDELDERAINELNRIVKTIGKFRSVFSLKKIAESAHMPLENAQKIYASEQGRKAIDEAVGAVLEPARMEPPDFLDGINGIVRICQTDYPNVMRKVDARLGREIGGLDSTFHYVSRRGERWLNQNVVNAYYERKSQEEAAAHKNAGSEQTLRKIVSALETLDDFPTFNAVGKKGVIRISDINDIYNSDAEAAKKIGQGVRDALGRIVEKPVAEKRDLLMGGTPQAVAVLIDAGVKMAAIRAAQESESALSARDALREIGLDYSAIVTFVSRRSIIYGAIKKEVKAAGVGKTKALTGVLPDEDRSMRIIEAAKKCDRLPTTAAISDITGIKKTESGRFMQVKNTGLAFLLQ